jgi:hypothetical protein
LALPRVLTLVTWAFLPAFLTPLKLVVSEFHLGVRPA